MTVTEIVEMTRVQSDATAAWAALKKLAARAEGDEYAQVIAAANLCAGMSDRAGEALAATTEETEAA